MTKDGELLPCPFCGSDAATIAKDRWTYEPGCTHCGSFIGQYSSARAAIAAWNRRSPLSQKTSCSQCAGEGAEREPVFHLRSYGDVSREELERLTAAPRSGAGEGGREGEDADGVASPRGGEQ